MSAAPEVGGIPAGRRRIDVFLSYYRPHVSGLTNAAVAVAEAAAARGDEVHVHCVNAGGPSSVELLDGVAVHRYRRTMKLGRAALSWSLVRAIWALRRRSGLAHVHLPYPESFALAWILGRGWRFLVTYHCDAPMTGGTGSVIARLLDWSHRRLIRRSAATVTSSDDYAEHSRLREAIAPTGTAIPAPAFDRAGGSPKYAEDGVRLIGFMGRPTHEKGIDVLLEAIEGMAPDVRLLLAGPVTGLSERHGYDTARLQRMVDAGRVRVLGFVEDEGVADFFASLDVYAFPSVNSFEAFGIVQVEAMSAGVPVVASDLPGVRTVVAATGLGEVVRTGDAEDLRRGLMAALSNGYDRVRARVVLEERYLSPRPEIEYLRLLDRID